MNDEIDEMIIPNRCLDRRGCMDMDGTCQVWSLLLRIYFAPVAWVVADPQGATEAANQAWRADNSVQYAQIHLRSTSVTSVIDGNMYMIEKIQQLFQHLFWHRFRQFASWIFNAIFDVFAAFAEIKLLGQF